MTTKPQDRDSPAPNAHDAKLIKRLFDRFDVADRARSRKVEAVLGISYAAAHRRVSGDLAWTLDEVERMAAHYGLSLADLVLQEVIDEAARATLALAGLTLPCRVWLGEATDPDKPTPLVAVKKGTEWLIVPAIDAGEEPSFAVKTLLCSPKASQNRPRVAVLDDSADTTEPACGFLRAAGFEAEPFATVQALRAALKTKKFDAYLIDWLIDQTTAAELLLEIRAADAVCPIAVLTGKVREGRANVTEVAAVVARIDADYYEKPAPLPIIATKFKKLLLAADQKLPSPPRQPA